MPSSTAHSPQLPPQGLAEVVAEEGGPLGAGRAGPGSEAAVGGAPRRGGRGGAPEWVGRSRGVPDAPHHGHREDLGASDAPDADFQCMGRQ